MRVAVLLTLILAAWGGAAGACGSADAPCHVGLGEYRIALPDRVRSPPALLWLHGWGGSPDGAMRGGMADRVTARGYALIAPEGLASGGAANRDWSVRDGRDHHRDDLAFLRAVVADAVARHGVDGGRVLLAGFSRGGSMVWDVACHAPELARAYAPVAGAFWEPMPERCTGPVDLLHVHGWADRTVPLEGRPLRGGELVQGDVFESLRILRAANGCTNRQPAEAASGQALWTRHWTDCAAGRIDFVLHPGGHVIPDGWLDRTLDWFEALPPGECAAAGDGGQAC